MYTLYYYNRDGHECITAVRLDGCFGERPRARCRRFSVNPSRERGRGRVNEKGLITLPKEIEDFRLHVTRNGCVNMKYKIPKQARLKGGSLRT